MMLIMCNTNKTHQLRAPYLNLLIVSHNKVLSRKAGREAKNCCSALQ